MRKNNTGFTLPELITVVVIIGILTAVAMPNYQQYIIQSKLSEAYRIIGSIQKTEVAFFYENKEFYDLDANPTNLASPMSIESNDDWARIGYPAPIGSNTYFTYKARAGKIDSTGSELNTSTLTSRPFIDLNTDTIANASYASPAVTCNSGSIRPTTIGAVSQNNYDYIAIAAVGDLRNNVDTLCTAVLLLIDVAGNDVPRSRGGFVVINQGN